MLLWCSHVYAEITTDGTTGAALNLPGPDFQIGADLGKQQGGNLFHSFQDFNVYKGESATFSGPDSVNNVISRVTGGETSIINGILRSTMPNADMYFINPAGMMFGSNASLDVPGGFYASTADTLKFADGAEFSASNPAQGSLTVANPVAFGFLDSAPAWLLVRGSELQIQANQELSLSGGGVTIEQAQIHAPGGELFIASVGDSGLNGKVSVRDSTLSTSGEGGGKIVIRGGQFVLDESLVHSDTLGAVDGQGIDVRVDNLEATGGSRLTSSTVGSGKGGDINFHAKGKVEFSGNKISDYGGILSHSGKSIHPDAGDGGGIYFESNNLTLLDGAGLESVTYGNGKGGDITAKVTGSVNIIGKQ
jgi:filamentous hemagglutinin family protein